MAERGKAGWGNGKRDQLPKFLAQPPRSLSFLTRLPSTSSLEAMATPAPELLFLLRKEKVDDEINKNVISPSDFTVMVTQDAHTDHAEDLEGIYWAWAEHVNHLTPEFYPS